MSAGLAFQLLRPSSDRRKSRRLMHRLRRDFVDQLAPAPHQSEGEFESRVYHAVSQLSQSQDQGPGSGCCAGAWCCSIAATSSGSSGFGAAGIRPSIWCGTAVCALKGILTEGACSTRPWGAPWRSWTASARGWGNMQTRWPGLWRGWWATSLLPPQLVQALPGNPPDPGRGGRSPSGSPFASAPFVPGPPCE